MTTITNGSPPITYSEVIKLTVILLFTCLIISFSYYYFFFSTAAPAAVVVVAEKSKKKKKIKVRFPYCVLQRKINYAALSCSVLQQKKKTIDPILLQLF